MPKTRKRARVEAELTETESEEETTEKVTRRKGRTPQKNETVVISRHYFEKAVEKIRNHGSKAKRKHPLIERNGCTGGRALNSCHSCSLDNLNRSLVQPVVYTPTWNLLVKTLRKAILARNWNYCLRLFDAYLNHGSLRRQHLLYLMRLTFLLLFNLNVSSERLNNFLTVTLSKRSPENQETFLLSLIELIKFSDVKSKTAPKDNRFDEDDPDDNVSSDEEDDSGNIAPSGVENDPDDIIISSDEDDPHNIAPSGVEDDPDNTVPIKEEAISCDDDYTAENSDLSDSD